VTVPSLEGIPIKDLTPQADRLGQEIGPMLRKGDYGAAVPHLVKRIRKQI
jgi:hypothetical protein